MLMIAFAATLLPQRWNLCLSELHGRHTVAVLPMTFFGHTLIVRERTPAVLLPIHEFASVPSPIRPLKGAKSMLCIVFVLTAIPSAVRKRERARAMHQALLPLTLILAAIRPHEDSMAIAGVDAELALIATACTISPISKGANAVLGTCSELTDIATTIGMTQRAVAMLLALRPLTPV